MPNERNRPDGVIAAGGILDRIVEAKAIRLKEAKLLHPIDGLMTIVERRGRGTENSFVDRITRKGVTNIIAEIKSRSPSKGIIRQDFNPGLIAQAYERAGAAALSVLTEEDFFGGSLVHLRSIRDGEALSDMKRARLPLLRKDFIFDEYQMYEAAFAGADAALLIVAILDDDLLRRLIELAGRLQIAALVEVHTANEMKRAVDGGATVIGVNNRDLTTFNVDLKTSLNLAPLAPGEAILVSESGITSGENIRLLKSAGFDAFLIGEHFMRAADPGDALARLIAESD
jgi:indole-3-glycerol phosphate synthase